MGDAMKQRKRTSLVESLLNIAIGYGIALGSQIVVFPLFGIYVSLQTNILIGLVFTVISIVRSYVIRRLFEHLRVTGIMP
jgi:hypothetical protein